MPPASARRLNDYPRDREHMGAFKAPHGGELKNLYLPADQVPEAKRLWRELPSWDLNMRQLCDIELLLNGAFSPLEGFQGEKDYQSVVKKMRLANGTIWPMPITLYVTDAFAQSSHEVGE